MENIMEPDELKSAWQDLGRRIERQDALNLQLLRERKLDKLQRSLRPLFWGQIAQMLLIGVPFIALAALLWMRHPQHASVIVAGVLVHAYGVASIIGAGIVLGQVRAIDNAAPVLEIQKKLANLRRSYVISGMVAGLPWWFLWITVLQVLAGLGDVSLAERTPSLVWIGYGVGAAGLLGTWWFHHWARRPERAEFGRKLDASLGGGSLRRAQAQLDELRAFERE